MQNLRKLRWLSTVLSAILGLVAGPLIEAIHPPFFQSANLPYPAFLMSSVLFLAVASYVPFLDERVSEQTSSIAKNMAEIAESLGVKVRFVSIGRGNSEKMYRHLVEIFSKVRHEILVVNYGAARRTKDLSFDAIALLSPERRRYYEVLAQKVRESEKGRLKFKRIVQMVDVNSDKWLKVTDSHALQHNLQLAQIGEKQPEFASLRKSEVFCDTTFAVLDRRQVLLSIDAIDPEDNEYYVVGHLLFDDPEGKLVQEFVRLFERIEAYSILVKPSEMMGYLAENSA